MAYLQMEMFEMQQSYREESEDSDIDKNIFLRKIFLFTFAEYFVTFLAALPLEDTIGPIVFYCFLPVSLAFQIYFEFQGEIRNQTTRSILNYVFGSLSIISNYFSNFFIWNILCFGDVYSFFYWGKILQLTQIILVLFVFMFYTGISKTNLNHISVWILSIIIPFLLLFFLNFIYLSVFYISTTVITWFLIMMVMMTKEMKQVYNSYDEIFIHSCRLLGVPFQILVYILKFILTSHYSEDYLYQANNKEKVAYLRKVAVTMFTITFFLLILSTQASFCDNNYYDDEDESQTICNLLIEITNLTFKPFYWVSLGISFVTYVAILIGHHYFQHWIINWTLFLVQVVFYSFVIFGSALYVFVYQYGDFLIYGINFCSLCGVAIGLLIYVFNMADNLYSKSYAIGWMIFCPTCIWIAEIYMLVIWDPILIAYSFGLLLGYLIFAIWIAWELEWQLKAKTFDLKQYDYYIGAIQILEPGYSVFSRLFTTFT